MILVLAQRDIGIDWRRTIAKYRTPRFNEPQAKAKPMHAISFEIVMCHVRSLNLPDEYETRTDTKVATKKGGQVRTSVMVVLYPSVLTTVGIKFLNPLADKWRFVIRPGERRVSFGLVVNDGTEHTYRKSRFGNPCKLHVAPPRCWLLLVFQSCLSPCDRERVGAPRA